MSDNDTEKVSVGEDEEELFEPQKIAKLRLQILEAVTERHFK